MLTTDSVASVLAVATAGIAAVTDLKTGRIPNWLTLGALGGAPVLWLVLEGGSTRAAGMSLVGAFACALMPAIYFARGKMGGGDVKLLAALGALLGPVLGLHCEFFAFAFSALFVPAKLAWEGRLFRVLGGVATAALNPIREKAKRVALPAILSERMRLGPAILCGTALAVFAKSYIL